MCVGGGGPRGRSLGLEGGAEEVMLRTETLGLSHSPPSSSSFPRLPRKSHLEQPGPPGVPGWRWGGKVKG